MASDDTCFGNWWWETREMKDDMQTGRFVFKSALDFPGLRKHSTEVANANRCCSEYLQFANLHKIKLQKCIHL